jgi:hypothetical protein
MRWTRAAARFGLVLAGAIGGSATLLLAQGVTPPTQTTLDFFDEPCLSRRAAAILGDPAQAALHAARVTSIGPELRHVGVGPHRANGSQDAVYVALAESGQALQYIRSSDGVALTSLGRWRSCGRYSSKPNDNGTACEEATGEVLAFEAAQDALAYARLKSGQDNQCVVRIPAAASIAANMAATRGLGSDALEILREIRDRLPPRTSAVGGLPSTAGGKGTNPN